MNKQVLRILEIEAKPFTKGDPMRSVAPEKGLLLKPIPTLEAKPIR